MNVELIGGAVIVLLVCSAMNYIFSLVAKRLTKTPRESKGRISTATVNRAKKSRRAPTRGYYSDASIHREKVRHDPEYRYSFGSANIPGTRAYDAEQEKKNRKKWKEKAANNAVEEARRLEVFKDYLQND